jgi:hypothetical protein
MILAMSERAVARPLKLIFCKQVLHCQYFSQTCEMQVVDSRDFMVFKSEKRFDLDQPSTAG